MYTSTVWALARQLVHLLGLRWLSLAAVHGIMLAGCGCVVHCANVQWRTQCRCKICIRVKEVQTSCAVLRAAGGFAMQLVTKVCAADFSRESMS